MRACCKRKRTDCDGLFPEDRELEGALLADAGVDVMFFPMFLMSWPVVMGLRRMEAHQTLRRRGQLTEWDASLAGRVVFISHEWLAFLHPDPDGLQLRTLQRLLERAVTGHFVVEIDPGDASCGFQSEKAGGAQWKATMPRCHLWIDYAGVPQTVAVAEGPSMMTSSDHRSTCDDDTMLAVYSIPAYIGASSLLIVLTPHAQHHDIGGRVCNFDSWLRRGWCRVEVQSALMAPKRLRVMLCVGPEAPTYFMAGTRSWFAPPGLGEFTCCANMHRIRGRAVPCDRVALRQIMAKVWEASAAHAWNVGDPDRMRFLVCREHYWMRGFPPPPGDRAAGDFTQDLRAFRARIRWGEISEHSPRSVRSKGNLQPWTLLHWAALTGCAALVREILCQEGTAALNASVRPIPAVGLAQPSTALILAGIASSGTFDAADVLIDARADPETRVDLLRIGRIAVWTIPQIYQVACLGNASQLKAWLQRFPHHVDATVLGTGTKWVSPLSTMLRLHEDLDDRWRILLSRGADPRNYSTISACEMGLLFACGSPTPSLAAARAMLQARCDVNARMWPSSAPMKAICYAAIAGVRLAERRGREASATTSWRARFAGATPLHNAAEHGSFEVAGLLLEARAYYQRNALGETPLQTAMWRFGGAPPEALIQLLATPGGADTTVGTVDS